MSSIKGEITMKKILILSGLAANASSFGVSGDG